MTSHQQVPRRSNESVKRTHCCSLGWVNLVKGFSFGIVATDEVQIRIIIFTDQHVSTDGSTNFISLTFIMPANSTTLNEKLQMHNKCSLMFDAKSILEHLDWDTNRMDMLGLVDYDK
ncbi:hypothetical protein CAPTEDRAFT_190835 [Capitella teleta]|uniref:Uncharacterized protein n=1 Tax=Capitella teleta TaxID=283909 RepID=R7U635_CAPTE|nr:hypothetical protein CAPTEDRAFT_190835 [Capitella teleta]|eukprot:ELT98620.1 hypothetical protein CAPTEDRAFT_190835 [Capitella teleta]